MADPITREQVERAMDAAYDCNAQGVNAALGAEWYKDPRIPSDVLAGWRETGYTSLYRALTRWRDELVVARWDADRRMVAEGDPDGCDSSYDSDEMEEIRAAYAAALSAAEAERPAKPDPLAYADSPAWDDWPMPKPVPALEMVDVPQPVVKRMGDHTAAWERGESEVSIATKMAAGPDRVMGYPLALLRVMIEAIDAQQGGAS